MWEETNYEEFDMDWITLDYSEADKLPRPKERRPGKPYRSVYKVEDLPKSIREAVADSKISNDWN